MTDNISTPGERFRLTVFGPPVSKALAEMNAAEVLDGTLSEESFGRSVAKLRKELHAVNEKAARLQQLVLAAMPQWRGKKLSKGGYSATGHAEPRAGDATKTRVRQRILCLYWLFKASRLVDEMGGLLEQSSLRARLPVTAAAAPRGWPPNGVIARPRRALTLAAAR